ncbi:MAG: endolytic transglycosylase MltG [Clostridiales bacterium]|nr:endolytic transglycosylase MltG [Clostridiales bacterium]
MRRREDLDYTHDSLVEEREYGLYWYSWLWNLVRPVLVFVSALLLLIGLVSYGWGRISAVFIDPVDKADTQPVAFTVAAGDSLTRVSNNLESQNLIRNRSVFKYFADFMGFGQKIQAGEYTLSRSMTINQIADQLTSGDGRPIVRNITVIPGWNVETIADYLVKEGAIPDRAAFLDKARTGADFADYYYIADVLAARGAAQRKYVLEGYLSPDTYEVYTDASVDDIIKKLLSQTEAVFKEPLHARAEELGMSMDQVITLASLIEKEGKTADFAKVSAVFHGRLRQNMALGSDVTIKYVSGTTRMALTREDLGLDSPYNTYTHKGLPPGPICSPSPAAIQAALHPDEQFLQEGFLYFCSKDPNTGELHFSKTLAEHEYAVSVYAPLWEAYDKRTNAQ